MERIFLMFLDHTQWRTTVGRTSLDEWSVRCRDLYLTTQDTHNRQISMPPVGFEPTISAGERPQAARLLLFCGKKIFDLLTNIFIYFKKNNDKSLILKLLIWTEASWRSYFSSPEVEQWNFIDLCHIWWKLVKLKFEVSLPNILLI